MAAQTVETHFHRTQANPIAAADDTAAPRRNLVAGCNREADRSGEFDPVGTFIELD